MTSINEVSHTSCTGCGLCAQVCPVGAIDMNPDAEGFLTPHVNESLCIDCGRCLKGCSAASDVKDDCRSSTCAYIARSAMHDTWKRSSSGGVAFAASRFVLEAGGVVAACAIDPDGSVRHRIISDADDLWRTQGSKYVQSEILDIYQACRSACMEGRAVLFIGTPCQVYAIKHYLRKFKDRLLTIDLICHGVPSPSFWHRDLRYRNKRNQLVDVERILFRWTSDFERTSFVLMDDEHAGRNARIESDEDPFYSAFINGFSYRESCYSCKFACLSRVGDMTIGDCATADRYLSFDLAHPVSTVLLNSEAGNQLFSELIARDYISAQEIDLRAEAGKNAQLSHPASRPSIRSEIYHDLQSMDFGDFATKYTTSPSVGKRLKSLVKTLVPVYLRQRVKRILQKG